MLSSQHQYRYRANPDKITTNVKQSMKPRVDSHSRQRRFGIGQTEFFDLAPDIWMFIAGFSVVIDVPLAGRVMGTDAACLVGMLWLAMSSGKLKWGSEIRRFILLVAAWLIGAIITDIIRSTPVDDVIRGWSKIILFGIVFVYLASHSKVRLAPLISFLAGLYIGLALKPLYMHVYGADVDPWKFGYGPAVTFICLVLLTTPQCFRLIGTFGQCAILMTLGGINLIQNSRSEFGMLVAVAVIAISAKALDRPLRGRPLPVWIFVAGFGAAFMLFQGVGSAYSYLAESGYLGDAALAKYQDQQRLGLGLLMGGRVESLVSTRAIIDSPIIGHGSWARDVNYKIMLVEELRARGSTLPSVDIFQDDLIPTHSHLLGAWVESGVLGAIFWLYAFGICLVGLYFVFQLPIAYRPLVIFTSLTLMWDILFSPFAAERRFFIPAELLVLYWAIGVSKGRSETMSLGPPLSRGR